MSTESLRIDKDLVVQAGREARIQNRSKAKQLEYWAKLGKAISSKLNVEDVFAISQGFKIIRLEPMSSPGAISIDSNLIFNELENDRSKGVLAGKVTSAKITYEASVKHPGYLDQVNAITNERKVGSFENGEFKAL